MQINDLSGVGSNFIKQAAEEAGMDGRWTEFENVERHWALFDLMINHLPVTPVELARDADGRTFSEAVDRCMRCSSTDRCEPWLAAADASAPPPTFCPLRNVGLA